MTREELIESGLLIPLAAQGMYAFSEVFEKVVDKLNHLIDQTAVQLGAERMRFPPGMAIKTFQESGYFLNFPHLTATVHCYCGDEARHRILSALHQEGEEWRTDQRPSDIALAPAACYPVYGALAARGRLPPDGVFVDAAAHCYRNEPSDDPFRLRFFRMRELVHAGDAASVQQFRDRWVERGSEIAESFALNAHIEVANDPFFGAVKSALMGNNQKEQQLKFELVVCSADGMRQAACMSFNYHRDHFGELWGMVASDGRLAHSACVAFGIERLVVALFLAHGANPGEWPAKVRQTLAI